MKLQFAVSRPSLIFQKRFPDPVSSKHGSSIASTSCTRSNIATINQHSFTKYEKKRPLKPAYVVPIVFVLVVYPIKKIGCCDNVHTRLPLHRILFMLTAPMHISST